MPFSDIIKPMMYNLFNSNTFNIVLVLLAIWTIPWKGYALWLCAKRNQPGWFIVLLILNTVGILEIFYIFKIAKKNWEDVKKDFRKGWNSIFS
jgi:methionyl-tRNA synthetase